MMIANLREGVSVCRRYDIGNQQQDGGGTRDERASRRESDDATERRKYKPREQCVVERVVRPECASNLGEVVVSLKKTFIIVIEGLFCTMSWDGRGKLHLQALSGLAVFFMWPNFLDGRQLTSGLCWCRLATSTPVPTLSNHSYMSVRSWLVWRICSNGTCTYLILRPNSSDKTLAACSPVSPSDAISIRLPKRP